MTSRGRSFPWLVGLAVLAVAACIDVRALHQPTDSGAADGSAGHGGTLGGAGGSGGSGGTDAPPAPDTIPAGIPLGGIEVDGSWQVGNPAGVRGAWWSTGDLYGADDAPGTGTCPMAGFSPELCSVLTTPTPGMPFRPGPNGMCTTGIAARVLNGSDGQPAWTAIWGNMIAFDVNNPGDGVSTRDVYDAPAHGFGGLMFDIDSIPAGRDSPGHMRVSFATRGTENGAAFWQGALNDLSPVTKPGHYEIRWSEVGGPSYLLNPPPFDPATLEAVAFNVVSDALSPITYSFCITNVMFLRK
jgi:hypothetical protein